MAERSDDIDAFDFDFFEEPATEEAAQRQQPRRRGPRRPVRPPAGLTPLLRLIGLIAFAIAVVVVLVLWVQSCRADSKRDQYSAYNDDVRIVATESAAIGRNLIGSFTTRGLTQAELAKRVTNLAQQQQQGVERAREVEPPGRMREVHERAVDALQLRAGGLQLLAQTFARAPARGTGGGGNQGEQLSAALLAQHMQRLLASDILWDDLYRVQARAVLRQQGLFGINVPDSNFLTDLDFATPRGMAPLVERVKGATTGGRPSGTHGNGIVQVRALPSGKVLDTEADNTITLTPDLQIEVTVENSGEAQEVQVPVRLTLQQSPNPERRTRVIPVIDPGQRLRVVFSDLADEASIGGQTQLKIEVEPVTGEANTDNNTRQFPVTFLFTPTE